MQSAAPQKVDTMGEMCQDMTNHMPAGQGSRVENGKQAKREQACTNALQLNCGTGGLWRRRRRRSCSLCANGRHHTCSSQDPITDVGATIRVPRHAGLVGADDAACVTVAAAIRASVIRVISWALVPLLVSPRWAAHC